VKNFLERIEKDPVPDVRLDALEALGQTTKPGVPEVSRITLCVFKSPMGAAPSTDDTQQTSTSCSGPKKRRCYCGRVWQASINMRSGVTVDA
jgi:hypothetical protein